ncbi:UNVERIFIED_CONTAM: Leucine-rich repeat receptor-like serine/threonine/tyrosine-protein kinase SOBIR1 [Sesamum angustifolium]|uniref:Leucine-rich repeat receptor-like serine/threonine/tyrosine-protein kinase SOBIR1 n=1 Tax=Sesamum angustifolium TaxID=2727405 RepID=A0AAW2Q9R0_9LAMI
MFRPDLKGYQCNLPNRRWDLFVCSDFGIEPKRNPCNLAGIFCERRITNTSDSLRVSRLVFESQRLRGKLSPAIGQLSELQALSLPDNQLVGQIPPQIIDCKKLEVLNLRNNGFSGKIPIEISSLIRLRVLDLSSNKFTGDLKFLKYFPNLEKLNLAVEGSVSSMNNRFDQYLSSEFTEKDSIPKRYAFAESSLGSNQSTSVEGPSSRTEQKQKHKKKKKKAGEWILIFLAGALAGSGSGLGCGEVYKAVLPGSNGKEIAIKKIIQTLGDAQELTEEDSKLLNKKMRQIRSEIQTVGQIRHRNLVPVLAHLPLPNCHYLVYEYMKNGSLQDYLQYVAAGRRELNWLARYKIALGVAAGLEYLHMNHKPCIIHRDLKPGNILLDDEMEARIADFGLAKALPDANTHVTTSNVAGTVGYIAPEYYQTFKFTEKCDVYSFGVLLGVLVSGKFPSDEFFQDTYEMSLMKWIRNLMTSEDPKRAIDPRLLGKGYEEQMLLVLKVACFCTLSDPKERPNSRDARCMLSQIEH